MSGGYRPGVVPAYRGNIDSWSQHLVTRLDSELVAIAKHLNDISTGGTVATRTVVSTSTGGGAITTTADHALLSATHSDTLSDAIVRGDLLVVNASTLWSRFPIGSADQFVGVNAAGTDHEYKSFVEGAFIDIDHTAGAVTISALTSLMGFWRFDTDTTATDPGSGDIKYNNATPSLVTTIYISQTTNGSTDAEHYLAQIKTGDGIYIQQRADSTRWSRWVVSATPTDNGAWWTIPVIYDSSSGILPQNNAEQIVQFTIGGTGVGVDHGLLSGLTDDDHPQYLLLAGRAGGQTAHGGVAAGEDLHLRSTAHATKGNIFFGAAGTHTFDEVNGRWGFGVAAPATTFDLNGTYRATIGSSVYRIEQDQVDATNQFTRVGVRHYTLSEEPMALIVASASSGNNQINYGGGTALMNLATAHFWHVGADSITTGTNEVMRLVNPGYLSIGGTSGNARIRLQGTITADHAFRNDVVVNSSTTGTLYGILNDAAINPAGASLSNAIGATSIVNITGSSLTITNAIAVDARIDLESGFSGTVTTGRVYRALNATVAGGTLTNQVGFNCDALTSGSTINWAFRGAVASSANGARNAYMDGTAFNYFKGNISLGADTYPASATQSFTLFTGTAPTGSVTDGVALYSADTNAAAGKAGLHVRTEDGTSHVFGNNIGIGTLTGFGTSAANVVSIANGTAPTTSPTNVVQLWSALRNSVAGTAGLNIRTDSDQFYIFADRSGFGTLTPGYLNTFYRDTADTDPQVAIEQDGTGDATLAFVLTGEQGWMMGIDNTDNHFKLDTGLTNLSGGVLTVTSGGLFGFNQEAPTASVHIGANTVAGHIRMDGIGGNPASPTSGDIWYSTVTVGHRFQALLGREGLVGLFFTGGNADSTDITNTTTETDYSNGSFTVPAQAIVEGMVIRVVALIHNDHTALTPTVTIRLKYGAVVLSSYSILLNTARNNDPAYFEWHIYVRTGGVAGVTQTSQFASVFNGTAWENTGGTTNQTAIDFLASAALKISAQWDAASASNTTTLKSVHMEVLNSVA